MKLERMSKTALDRARRLRMSDCGDNVKFEILYPRSLGLAKIRPLFELVVNRKEQDRYFKIFRAKYQVPLPNVIDKTNRILNAENNTSMENAKGKQSDTDMQEMQEDDISTVSPRGNKRKAVRETKVDKEPVEAS